MVGRDVSFSLFAFFFSLCNLPGCSSQPLLRPKTFPNRSVQSDFELSPCLFDHLVNTIMDLLCVMSCTQVLGVSWILMTSSRTDPRQMSQMAQCRVKSYRIWEVSQVREPLGHSLNLLNVSVVSMTVMTRHVPSTRLKDMQLNCTPHQISQHHVIHRRLPRRTRFHRLHWTSCRANVDVLRALIRAFDKYCIYISKV